MYDYKNNPGSYTFEDNGATAEYITNNHKHIPANLLVLCFAMFLLGFVLCPLVYLLVTGDFPGSRMFYGLQEDSTLITFLLNLR